MCNSSRNNKANINFGRIDFYVKNSYYNYISNYNSVTANIPRNEYSTNNRNNVRLHNLKSMCANIIKQLNIYLELNTSLEFTHGQSGKYRALLLSHLMGNIHFDASANVVDIYENIFQNYIIIYAKKQDFFKAFRGQIKVDRKSSMTYVINVLYEYFKYFKKNFEYQNHNNELLFIFFHRIFSNNPDLDLNKISYRKAILSNIQRINIIQ